MKRRAIALLCALLAWGGAQAASPQKGFPFFPSLMNTRSGGYISAETFFEPKECRGCHGEIYNQWRGSMHSLARFDPVFLALWERGAREAGEDTGRLCAGCHAAPAVLSGEVKLKPGGGFELPKTADSGVSCHVCHSIVASSMAETPSGLPQNTSIVFDPSMVMRGPFGDSNPMWHKAEYSELHTKAEFCGNCHNVFHPVSNFRIENTYTEWKNSVYAEKGIVCQDCHMMGVEKAVEAAKTMTKPVNPGYASKVGPLRPNVFTHEFVGANYTVPALMGYPEKSVIAVKRLKSAAEIAVAVPEKAKVGEKVRISVRVTNIGAGHNLPTSLTEVRQMWLDVRAADGSGKTLLASGVLDAAGDLPREAISFGAETVDAEGKPTLLPWKMDKFTRFNTIPPKAHVDAEYFFTPGPESKGRIKVTATLRYRSYPQSLANELLGAKAPRIDVIDMSTATAAIAVED